jgi:hypothetical protein
MATTTTTKRESSEASAQTDADIVSVKVPGQPDIIIPKSAQPAFSTLLEWCKKQVDTAVKSTVAEMKSSVEALQAQVVALQTEANVLKGKTQTVKAQMRKR